MATRLLEPRTEPQERLKMEPRRDVPRWVDRLLETRAEASLTAGRLILGGVMFAHASQKVLGWFGGPGFSGTIQSFQEHLGIPLVLAVLVVLAEFLGSISLIVGFLGRVGAACIFAVMTGAIVLVHAKNGFFMNWFGTAPGEGYEYHLLAIGLAIVIIARGSGALSMDGGLLRRLRPCRTGAMLTPRRCSDFQGIS